MKFIDRIGIDIGRRVDVDEGLRWVAKNKFYHVEAILDDEFTTFNDQRIRSVREYCKQNKIRLNLHTSSAVNTAETSPVLSDAVDQYLKSYIDLAKRLGCEWIVVHAGYHFTSDFKARQSAALEHIQRAVEYAQSNGILVLLENMNWEPTDAEIHYLGYNIEEFKYFLERISSPNFGWTFTVNHAHIVPEGVDGFLDEFGLERLYEVRLADSHGHKEEHLNLGQGTIDFLKLIKRLESDGYRHHYMLCYGGIEDMRDGRDYLLEKIGRE